MPVPWPTTSEQKRPRFGAATINKIKDPSEQAISLRQLRELSDYCQRLCKTGVLTYGNSPFDQKFGRVNKRVKWTQLTQHEICNLILKKIIPNEHSCSWVELVSGGKPQKRNFFCSHNWGECFRDFMVSINGHAREQGVSTEDTYWICVYANNQHNVELGATLEESPFYSALKGAKATLLMLDKTAEALLRIWCVFELNETLRTLSQDLQIWTPLGRVGSGLVSSGPVMQALQRVDTCRAQATSPVDQRQILNHIAAVGQTIGIKINPDNTKELDESEEKLKIDVYEDNLRKAKQDKFKELDQAVRDNVQDYLSRNYAKQDLARKTGTAGRLERAKTGELPEGIKVNLYNPTTPGSKPTTSRCRIDDGTMRGITLQELRDFHQKMKLDFEQNPDGLEVKPGKPKRKYDEADMYAIDKLYMEPYRNAAKCSYVEIVTEKASRPEYHVIYGSALLFRDFMAALEWHAEARQLPDTTAYFIVPFALDPDDADRPEETKWTRNRPPTKQVIEKHVIGQVMLVDSKASILTRCIPAWEAHQGISKGLTFDLAGASGALATTSPFANNSWEFGDFDAEVAMKALTFDVAKTEGNTSKSPTDRERYLGEIATGHTMTEEEIPESQDNDIFTRLNTRLREKVAGPVLREAGYCGDVSMIQKVMKACPTIMFSSDSLAGTMGERVVHTAAAAGHVEVLRLMLDLKAKPDPRDAMGETPLHYAAFAGKVDVTRLLLERHADPEVQSYDSETPLDVARLNPAYFLGVSTEGVAQVLGEEVKIRKKATRALLKRVAEIGDGEDKFEDLKDIVLVNRGINFKKAGQDQSGSPKASDPVKADQEVVQNLKAQNERLQQEIDFLRGKGSAEQITEVAAKQAAEAYPENVRVKEAFSTSGVRNLTRGEMQELLRKVTQLREKEINVLVDAAHEALKQQARQELMDCEWFLNWLYPKDMPKEVMPAP